jgi:hypothetical protein
MGGGEAGMNKWIPAFQLLGIGFYVVVCIVGGTMLGVWLGHKQVVWIMVGLGIGLVMAFYGMYRMLKPFLNDKTNNKNDRENR